MKLSSHHHRSTLAASALILIAGFGLTSCSPAKSTEQSTSPVAPSSASSSQEAQDHSSTPTASPTASSTGSTTQEILVQVNGSEDSALVKTLVVTSSGSKHDEEKVLRTLPYEKKFTLEEKESIVKILVLGTYPNGQTGEISCSLSINGQQTSESASFGHKPAKCLYNK